MYWEYVDLSVNLISHHLPNNLNFCILSLIYPISSCLHLTHLSYLICLHMCLMSFLWSGHCCLLLFLLLHTIVVLNLSPFTGNHGLFLVIWPFNLDLTYILPSVFSIWRVGGCRLFHQLIDF